MPISIYLCVKKTDMRDTSLLFDKLSYVYTLTSHKNYNFSAFHNHNLFEQVCSDQTGLSERSTSGKGQQYMYIYQHYILLSVLIGPNHLLLNFSNNREISQSLCIALTSDPPISQVNRTLDQYTLSRLHAHLS